ncbi:DNA polymerase III subunit alpha [Riemerella columbipharyngis]|uniref:DNA polymerase III subunit alpha n=1 Tax=Riemerella columbipharyngis TaxID=1071918 RepID=A0A1G6Y6B1_9FLAO|nr:DNA polymerase III subunit alpha [Riemerella columbipharyngis]SDD85513.1 DNA polymerase-3 subunit alpha [Riemerella columbipharyngis]
MYLIFDTETTGVPINSNAPVSDSENWPRMVQISWQLHNEEGNLIENQDYIIKPEGYDIPYNAVRIHGITTEMANKEGRDLAEVLAEFSEVLKKTKVCVGHNINFDYNIVGAEFYRKNISDTLAEIPVVDTMVTGTDYCKLSGGKNGRYKSPKLGELYEKLFGTTFDEAHNSAADVNATAQAFFEMMRIGIIPAEDLKLTEEQLVHFQNLHTDPIKPFAIVIRRQVENFNKQKGKTHFRDFREIELGDYFNFHNHSVFSSLQATSSISDLINKAKTNRFPAVGMVDLGNMMGAFKFIAEVDKYNTGVDKELKDYEERKKKAEEEGIEFGEPVPQLQKLMPILGCEFYISDRPEQKQFTKEDPDRRTNMVLLAKNIKGYRNLAKLSSLGYVNGFYFGVPRVSREMISRYKEGVIAMSSGVLGDIPDTILNLGEKKGEEVFKWWKDEFGEDFYVQIQNHHLQEEEYLNEVLLSFADKYDVKIIAQNETFYTNKDDSKIQDILYCIKDGEKVSTPVGKGFGKRRGLQTKEFYIKDKEELKEAFKQYPDAFEAYTELLSKFEAYKLKRDVLLPKFDIPEQFQSEEDKLDGGKRGENAYLRHLTYEGAAVRYDEITDEIRERLDFELDIIAKTGYPGYFLIVQDFCNEARKMGVWVGPGRGSAAGSAVAFCIGITNVDPIKYDLLFERFLNPERISMPDIDIDFDDEGRDKIIKWVIEKYGKSNVAQIITYSILGGKSAIKDAGRVLDVPIPETNNIAKLVPSTPGMNIAKALSKYDKLKDEEKELVDEMKSILSNPQDGRFEVLDSAKKMEGCIRNTGIHACGVIITPEDISNLVPITIAAKDANILVSQFDNSVAESAGLLKMDFLGLRTLTIIKDALKLIKERHGIDINPDEIPLDDAKTYQLFKEGRTIGIFQYESVGMQKYMRELKPTVFADLIAMNALYRPGPIKYIPNFIKRKHGLEEIVYDLPETEEYLKETYGITVYQEQVMLLSQKLANFTKGQADTLRKAMGKKQINVLNDMYPKFIEGGKKNNLDEEKLNKIWNDWKAFAEYAFNKSHSTCYALVAYQTAYLKANYPAEYMASVMSNNINNTKQITMFMEDCQSMGVDVLGPDVNESQYKFSVNDKGQIRFGLGAIKGIGEGPSETINEERKKGKFKDVYDFFERAHSGQINKRVVESLVVAGAFDELDTYHRAQYFAVDTAGRTNIENLLKYGQNYQAGKSDIENSLFADFAEDIQIEKPKILPCEEWINMHKLNKEKEIIGFYISAHPLDEFRYQFQYLQGLMSEETVLKKTAVENQEELEETKVLDNDENIADEDIPDIELEISEDSAGGIIEQEQKNVEARGKFQFLNLDEIDDFKAKVLADIPKELFNKEDKELYRKIKKLNANAREYTVAGIITDYVVKDSTKNPGDKIAFVTLEDYLGSYSFRLGDNDYMKFREYMGLQRFVVFKIKYSFSARNEQVYVNISEVLNLKDVFDKYAKSISIIMEARGIERKDIDFIKKIIKNYEGESALKIYLKAENPTEKNLELMSKNNSILINNDLIKEMKESEQYEFFLS